MKGTTESRVAALGGIDFVMPYKALGIETFPVEAARDAVHAAATSVAAGGYGLVIVAENVAQWADEVLGKFAQEPVPCVVVMPFTVASTGFALESLAEALKLATGIDIIRKQ
ncbi:MAG TPA: V-type ATP synthase subunit F [Sedimentisphaerales bacterium]|nr:V-type ATP synthase subunit F [Sedimentisphaerales bacterium]